MPRDAWEYAVNAEFVERIGGHIAKMYGGYMSDGFRELCEDYENTIGEIPDYIEPDEDDE